MLCCAASSLPACEDEPGDVGAYILSSSVLQVTQHNNGEHIPRVARDVGCAAAHHAGVGDSLNVGVGGDGDGVSEGVAVAGCMLGMMERRLGLGVGVGRAEGVAKTAAGIRAMPAALSDMLDCAVWSVSGRSSCPNGLLQVASKTSAALPITTMDLSKRAIIVGLLVKQNAAFYFACNR